MKNGSKEIVIEFENRKYVWYRRVWSAMNSNLTVNTALGQKLSECAIKLGLLNKDDFRHDD